MKITTVIIRTVQACANCCCCEYNAVIQKAATQIKRLIAELRLTVFSSKIRRYLRACSQQHTRTMMTTTTGKFWLLLMLMTLLMTMLTTATETARNLRRTSRQK